MKREKRKILKICKALSARLNYELRILRKIPVEASPIKKPPPNDLGEKHYLHPRMLVNDNLSSSPRSLGSRNKTPPLLLLLDL